MLKLNIHDWEVIRRSLLPYPMCASSIYLTLTTLFYSRVSLKDTNVTAMQIKFINTLIPPLLIVGDGIFDKLSTKEVVESIWHSAN